MSGNEDTEKRALLKKIICGPKGLQNKTRFDPDEIDPHSFRQSAIAERYEIDCENFDNPTGEEIDKHFLEFTKDIGLYETLTNIISLLCSDEIRKELNNCYREHDEKPSSHAHYSLDYFFLFRHKTHNYKILINENTFDHYIKLFASKDEDLLNNQDGDELLDLDSDDLYSYDIYDAPSKEDTAKVIKKFKLTSEQIIELEDYLGYLCSLFKNKILGNKKDEIKQINENFDQNIDVSSFDETLNIDKELENLQENEEEKDQKLNVNKNITEKKVNLLTEISISEDEETLSEEEIEGETFKNSKGGESKEDENPFLKLGFIEFGIISTLAVAFFPWSLLVSVIFYGLETTKLLILALIYDAYRTIKAILSVIIPLVFLIIAIIALFAG